MGLARKLFRGADFRYQRWAESAWRHRRRLAEIERAVSELEPADSQSAPVVFFNASTRTWGVSLNAAFSLLAAWGLRLGGLPVRHFVCEAGLEQCVLGTIRTRPQARPPCRECRRLSHQMFPEHLRLPLERPRGGWPNLRADAEDADLETLIRYRAKGLPLGELCLPSLRWALRRHTLPDVPAVHDLFRKYLRSASHLAAVFRQALENVRPRAVVVFNGVTYPEAVARAVALEMDIPVITHEVGLRPFSAFFTHGQATAYPIEIDPDFQLTPDEEGELDRYLAQRFRGEFSMAGVRFWPEMRDLSPDLAARMADYRSVVSVFTNVIFDTSQVHANTVFRDMFDWLDQVVDFARRRPDALFIVRAHPDELRPGKESQETVEEALRSNGGQELPNVVFIPPHEFINSYDLIQRSKLALVYNSSIGLEGTLLNKVVLSGGASRYTRYETVYFPQTPQAYFRQAGEFLAMDDPRPPQAFVREARRFLYVQQFLTSLDFSRFLRADRHFPGYVRFAAFDVADLSPESSQEIRILIEGITQGRQMFYSKAKHAVP